MRGDHTQKSGQTGSVMSQMCGEQCLHLLGTPDSYKRAKGPINISWRASPCDPELRMSRNHCEVRELMLAAPCMGDGLGKCAISLLNRERCQVTVPGLEEGG